MKSRKIKIRPIASPEKKPKTNFNSLFPQNVLIYSILIGDAKTYIRPQFQTRPLLAQIGDQLKNGKIAPLILCDSEVNAFKLGRENYPQHALTVLTLNLPHPPMTEAHLYLNIKETLLKIKSFGHKDSYEQGTYIAFNKYTLFSKHLAQINHPQTPPFCLQVHP